MKIYRLDNYWALFFLIIPVLCLLIIILNRFIFKKGIKISGVSLFERVVSPRIIGYFFALILTILGLFLAAFSLTKPEYGIKKEKIVSEGIDIMIALDTSYSMTNRDFLSQSRIEGAKNILSNFIDKRKGDLIGLEIFGESSLLKCPLTSNYVFLKSIIKRISIDPNKRMSNRTAIGIGLTSAVNRLLNLKDKANASSKIIILVTDGMNNAGEISPKTAMEIASQTGIKVYSIGIGESYEVDLDLLRSIADKTKGKFFHARTSGELGSIFSEIDKIEKTKIETVEFSRFKGDVGYRYASMGIIFIFLGLILNSLFFKRVY